jgi:uncharacterized protein (DUF2336 family)
METSSLTGLEVLSEIGLRGGADMRPTLLRVLTDLYVQKLTHTPDEERHYTELALRLLDSVDVQTRAAVAARLGRHLSPPVKVVDRLSADLPEVTAALRANRPAQARRTHSAAAQASSSVPRTHVANTAASRTEKPVAMPADLARELNELFFAATADERRLILVNLHIVVSPPAESGPMHSDSTVGRKLEVAALARRREDFVSELARSLRISREQARRIAGDESGEPIVIAAKALGIARDLLYRILLFINTAVGHSVERVHALAALYDEINVSAAADLVVVWQALNVNKDERAVAVHRPLLANANAAVRPATPAQRTPAAAPKIVLREIS